MLSYQRGYKSDGEYLFLRTFIDTIPGIHKDSVGNRILRIGKTQTMFSSHTDTVHHEAAARQTVLYDESLNLAYKDDRQPLGADDTAGVWLMLRMIEHKIPGLYIFHRGEEVGGIGSQYIARHTPQVLANINRAIAFDRRGTTDIITHQACGRCCSDGFAQALARELFMKHKPSQRGIFTDTANYTHLVAECTNVSVGYEHEHTSNEMLDVAYLFELEQAVREVNWETLPTIREKEDTLLDEDFDYFDLVYDHPRVAVRLLELCQPTPRQIEQAFDETIDDEVLYDSGPTY